MITWRALKFENAVPNTANAIYHWVRKTFVSWIIQHELGVDIHKINREKTFLWNDIHIYSTMDT